MTDEQTYCCLPDVARVIFDKWWSGQTLTEEEDKILSVECAKVWEQKNV